MKTQLRLLIALTAVLLLACYPLQYHNSSLPSQASQLQFNDMYSEFIDTSETIITEWYHYVITQEADGKYIKRTFFPETMTMTSEVRYRDKDLDITDGIATYRHDNGYLSSQGNYIEDKEDGVWNYYHRKTGELSQNGSYKLGDKIGNWKFYDDAGRLSSENTYVENQRQGDFIVYDTLNNVVNQGTYQADTIFQQSKKLKPIRKSKTFKVVEQMPRFYDTECEALMSGNMEKEQCAQGKMLQFIYKNLKYPSVAREYKVSGMTVIQFAIDTTGKIVDIETIKGVCQSMKETSETVVKSMPNFVPGMQRGKKVKVLYTLPIRYKLEG